MIHSVYCILLVCIFLNCSNNSSTYEIESLTDVLTLELTFGDKDISDDFLLSLPYYIKVATNDDIIVSDETRLKIYDMNGNPKQIVGGPGEGPGEFETIGGVSFGPKGHLSVWGLTISLFSRDYKFMNKERFRGSNLQNSIKDLYQWDRADLKKVIFLNNDEMLLHIAGGDPRGTFDGLKYEALILQKDKNLETIAFHKVEHDYTKPVEGNTFNSTSANLSFLSRFLWVLGTEQKVVYVETGKDELFDNQTGKYALHIIHMESGVENVIVHNYERTLIRDSQIERFNPNTTVNSRYPELKPVLEEFMEIAKDNKYNHSLQALYSDNNYVFAFTYKINQANEIFTDVFDIDSGEYISSAYFPFKPKDIKNGYAYNREKSDEGFYVVTKYKIDPKVYGK